MKALISPLAKLDLIEAKNYNKNIRTELAKDFLEEIKRAKQFISENPYANDISYKNVRMYLLKKFPYHLHYILNENKKHIVIIAIEFGKRGDLNFSHRI